MCMAGALPLHYACRNRGPTNRQDTALKLHSQMEPCVHRMVRVLLNVSSGYPQGASIADMDGMLPVDYILANPNARKESTVRSLKMLLYVSPESVALTIHKTELDKEPGSILKASKQCPGFNWQRLSTAYTKGISKVALKSVEAAPIGFGHDGRGKGAGAFSDEVEKRVVRQDLMHMSSQSIYTKLFFKEWRQVM